MSQRSTNPFFIRQLVEYVEQRLGHKLREDQLSWTRNFAKEHVPQQTYLTNIQMAQQIRHQGNHILRIIATHSQQREVVDVHEMLQDILRTDGQGTQQVDLENEHDPETYKSGPEKKDISVVDFLGMKNLYQFALSVQPRSIYGIQHLLMDTKIRNNPGDRFTLQWNLFNQAQQGNGIVTYPGTLTDITVVRVFGFYAPTPENLSIVQDDFNRRVFMQIEEFTTQSFFGPNRSQFQIPFSVDQTVAPDNTRLLRVFDENRGWFRLGLPVTRLDTITLRFYALSTPIEFPPERVDCVISWSFPIPSVVTITIPSISTAPGALYVLAVGDVVQFENYAQPAGLNGYFSNWLLAVGGHPISLVVNNQTYEIVGPPTSPPLPPPLPVPDAGAECVVVKRLMTIPIQVVYRRPEEEMEL